MRSIEARDDRLARHARQGYALAQQDVDYRATVLGRLSHAPEPRDLWTAIPWIWAATLGQPTTQGALSSLAQLAARELAAWLTSSESCGELRSRWQNTPFDPGSTLRSHPYHDRHSAYVEVLGAEAFHAPASWRERAKRIEPPELPDVRLVVPHPHDVLIAKLGRFEPADQDHIERILREIPADAAKLSDLADESPYRDGSLPDDARDAFERHFASLLKTLR